MIVYDTHIPAFIRDILNEKRYSQVFVLTDSNTFPIFKELQTDALPDSHICVIPAGEQHKTLSTTALVWEFLAGNRADRKSLLLNFGGGMICDLGGFAASTYMRGIRFMNIPTTLLAMADAAVGGKTGINLLHLKNYVGTFSPAAEVLIDTSVLRFLPVSELTNGWAEVLKHGIIAGGELWTLCRQVLPDSDDTLSWSLIVKQNIELKQSIVDRDPEENGLRRILNFGHTIGHAVETVVMNHRDYIGHGPAVAAGIITESLIAEKKGLLNPEICQEIISATDGTFNRLDAVKKYVPQILDAISGDKKNVQGRILMSLPFQIGDVRPSIDVEREIIEQALRAYAKA